MRKNTITIRSLSLCLTLLLLLSTFYIPVCATEEDGINVVSAEDILKQIDSLYETRALLLSDYEANQAAIAKIDSQLAHLGVESISAAEVAEKLGNTTQPCVDVNSTSTVEWTSFRTTVVSSGKQCELQVITGQAIPGTGSSLYNRDLFTVTQTNVRAAVTKALSPVASYGITTLVSSAFDNNPYLDGYIEVSELISDTLQAYKEAIDTTTVLRSVQLSYDVQVYATERYIFVKYQGAADSGNQILAYAGNSLACTVELSYEGTPVDIDGTSYPMTRKVYYYYKLDAPNYSNGYNYAASNFIKYKQGISVLNTHELINNFNLRFFYLASSGTSAETVTFDAPYAGMTFYG